MDIFQLTYFLTQACLGGITPNFRRIYFTVDNMKIKSYFILEEKNDEDIECIFHEIVSEFMTSVEDSDSYEKYDLDYEIIFAKGDDELPEFDVDITIFVYMRKEIFD
jgi:hypothetical protein